MVSVPKTRIFSWEPNNIETGYQIRWVPNSIGWIPNNIDCIPNSVETRHLFLWVPIVDSNRIRQLERWPRRRQAGGGRRNDVVRGPVGNAAKGWQGVLWDDRATAGTTPGSRGCYVCFEGQQRMGVVP